MMDKLRFWEVDVFRGIAIILMIIYHLIYDLNYFGGYEINQVFNFSKYMFIFLVGVSLALSFSRTSSFFKYLKRGLKIFSWGLIITLITWIFLREGLVIFGILHLIGISIILAYPFLRYNYLSLLLGGFLILIGVFLRGLTFGFPYLMWLGFAPENLYTFDYFPILPWFGLILVGVFVGKSLYGAYRRNFKFPDFSSFFLVRFFSYLGRHSLFIYLVHQPVLIVLLHIFGVINVNFL